MSDLKHELHGIILETTQHTPVSVSAPPSVSLSFYDHRYKVGSCHSDRFNKRENLKVSFEVFESMVRHSESIYFGSAAHLYCLSLG